MRDQTIEIYYSEDDDYYYGIYRDVVFSYYPRRGDKYKLFYGGWRRDDDPVSKFIAAAARLLQ